MSLASILGPTGRGPLVVLSPHLDDAVLSLGATIARLSRHGRSVRVVTAFANDPTSRAPAGPWDASCGFHTEGEAARARREEDRRACATVGAEPSWLPFGDEEYGRHAPEAEVYDALADEVRGADAVLVPGFPLAQSDHAALTRLVWQEPPSDAALGLYVEQPYAALRLMSRGGRLGAAALTPGRGLANLARIAVRRGRRLQEPPSASSDPFPPPEWGRSPVAGRDLRAKWRAMGAYTSQLRGFGPLVRSRLAIYELGWGGEGVASPLGPPRAEACPPVDRPGRRMPRAGSLEEVRS